MRNSGLTWATPTLPLVWTVLHLSKAGSSYPLGTFADRVGRLAALVAGALWYALSYWLFAAATAAWQAWGLFAVYGVFYGLTEGVGKAIVADLVEEGGRPWAFGLYNGAVGLSALPAGLLTGFVWKVHGAKSALRLDAGLAAFAALGFLLLALARSRGASRGGRGAASPRPRPPPPTGGRPRT